MTTTRPAHTKKSEIVAEIVSKIKNAQGVAIAEYKHLTVEQMSQLRREALKQNIEVKIYKDSLFRRAAKELELSELDIYLTQQNVFIFSNDEAIGAAKLVSNFSKKNENLVLKAGIYEGKALDTKGVIEIGALPSKDDLYSMFASSLIYPLRQFMGVVNAIADTKSE
ncbi:50S ribosomal protein L10 [Mesoplasma corruscae]|uniref:Large ribosomal subunit protein uL10 n=1 Tax=Mesoplasma corruscae TaxID=216874 RepID=A0A2S5RHH5_9MOLU|nr:50S ribosomal protein L10 [Mesoplasma corruscae]PPE06737.1 50S ribosomal protein L10 [Mesoplasma corruscae]